MRVAFILPSLANKGPILIAKYIIEDLVKNENIDVYYFDNVCELQFACNTYRIRFSEPIDFSKYDIIHTHQLRPDLYVWFHRNKIKEQTKIISTVHQEIFKSLKYEFGYSFKTFIGSFLWKFALQRKEVNVVVLNNSMKSQFSSKLECTTIGNGIPALTEIPLVDKDDINLIKELALKGKFVLGVASLLIKRKGIDQIIRALPNLHDFTLCIVGDGDERKNLENLALELGVLDRCLFLGFKQQGYRYFKYFDIYMLTSYSEGFPICSIEAAMFSLPIVASRIDVLRDIYSDKEVVFYTLNDISNLESAIKEASIKSAGYRIEIKKKFDTCLTSKVMSDKYHVLYKSLLNG